MSMVAVEHPSDVLEWRKESFLEMGFDKTAASYLAFTRIDLHEMRAMIAAGCPHNTAIKILDDSEESYDGNS